MKIKKNSGFTLIELLIAMSILSIVVMSFFIIINTSIRSNAKNEKDIVALSIAQSEIENLRKQIKLSSDADSYTFTSMESTKIFLNEENTFTKNIDGLDYNITIILKLANRVEFENVVLQNEQYNNLYNLSVSVLPQNLSEKYTKIETQICR